ncbi:MAG: radical SAM protein [Candidatus Hodarchaeota archaeon]
MYRDAIIIRPPCEAYSLLIGVTEGCSWTDRTGGCWFCGVYKGIQEYRIRPWESIKRDIDRGFQLHGKGVKHVFLAGGNALSAPTSLLVQVIKYLNQKFPIITRISSYAKNHDILQKNDEELRELSTTYPGLKIVYMGLESGSAKLLKYMNKGTTPRGMIRAAKKIKGAGIKLSVYVILGLGGNLFPENALETAKVLTEMNPDYIRFRSLNFIPTAPLFMDWRRGDFKELRPVELINEEIEIIENLGENVTSSIFNDHVSNPIYVDGKLSEHKSDILNALKKAASDKRIQALPHVNRTTM